MREIKWPKRRDTGGYAPIPDSLRVANLDAEFREVWESRQFHISTVIGYVDARELFAAGWFAALRLRDLP